MKLLHTKEYILLIDEEAEIKDGNYFVNIIQKEIYQNNIKNCNVNKFYLKLIIAYYPLTKEAKEFDLPLLPNPFERKLVRTNDIFIVENTKGGVNGDIVISVMAFEKFKDADNFIKDKPHLSINTLPYYILGCENSEHANNQFTLEDMEKVIELAQELVESRISYGHESKYSKEEIIKLVLTQKAYPKEFIPKYDYPNICYGECGICDNSCNVKVLKVITNSEGKEVLVGTYKY